MTSEYSAAEQRLVDVWERHLACEFTARDAVATVETMTDDNDVNHVPVMTGGRGREQLLAFYGRAFIPQMPADTAITPICRTVSVPQQRIVDEMIFSFTHDIAMDWMLPGIAATGRRVAIPLVVVVQLRDERIESERIYWDQAGVLAQLGLIDTTTLPVVGAASARKLLESARPVR